MSPDGDSVVRTAITIADEDFWVVTGEGLLTSITQMTLLFDGITLGFCYKNHCGIGVFRALIWRPRRVKREVGF